MKKRAKYIERRNLLLEAARSRELTATAKLVLLVLVERFSDAVSGEAFPGLTRLGYEIGHSKKTAQRGISELETLGFIDIQAPSNGRMTNLYTLVLCPEDRTRKRETRFNDESTRQTQSSRRKNPRRKQRARKPDRDQICAFEKAFGSWSGEVAEALGGNESAYLLLMEIGDTKLREICRTANACGQSPINVANDIRRRGP